ncbi:MAG: N-acetylglucosamine-6-phosphate deacetylase [Clostridiales bacterium]|nr:N-acetylglucosamine-6-phosphate deacetylase [Clostridiales bacterium]
MKCIINGTILLPDGEINGKILVFNEKITGIMDEIPENAEIIDANGGYVSPGLIDVHCHGFMGMDASNASYDEVRAMSEKTVSSGVTGWLPTTMTLSWEHLGKCFEAIGVCMQDSLSDGWKGAQVLGAHAEGPFINLKKKGAQDAKWVRKPDIECLKPWKDVVKLITVAPEVDGALEFIHEAVEMGVKVSMGHTNATGDEAIKGFDAGIDHATHTFNAMTPMSHRDIGAVGAALSDDRVYCELIADTFHVSAQLYSLLAKAKGAKLVIITDSIQVAGLPDGVYDMSGQTVVVDGIKCRFPDGTIAGSALTMDRAVRNFRAHTNLELWKIVRLASLSPAESIGMEKTKGSLEIGKDADILIADKDFNIQKTFVRGNCVYEG